MLEQAVSDVRWYQSRLQRNLRSCLDPFDRSIGPSRPSFRLSRLGSHARGANEAQIRAACYSVVLDDEDILCRILGRYKIYVDAHDKGLSSHLMLDGFWEMWVTETIARLVRPGMVAADIGANLGYYTILMGDLVGPNGHVHAFEPNPPIARRLRHSVGMNAGNRRTTVHEVALTDHDGSIALYAPLHEPKNATIVGAADRLGSVVVPARRLDSIAEIERLDFVKIDAEGAEAAIWRGMERHLDADRPPTILLEYAGDRVADPDGFIDAIIGRGFLLCLVRHDGRTVPIDKRALLALPRDEDQMLLLRR